MTEKPTSAPDLAPAALILAGGASSRMGFPKALLQLDGIPLVEQHLHAADAFGMTLRVVVLGYAVDTILGAANLETAITVVNPAPHQGQFSSLQTGIETLLRPSLKDRWAALMITPVDCPPPPSAVLRRLLSALSMEPDADGFIPTHRGRPGHPIVLRQSCARRLLKSSPRSRLDRVLREANVHHIDMNAPDILWNLNTPEDVARWRRARRPAVRRKADPNPPG